MNNFLTISDFVDNVQISISPDEQTDFDKFLGRMQIEFLRKVLGTSFYNSFKAGIEATSPATIWTNLRDGVDYEYDGEEEHFDGIKLGLKYYSYVKWLQRNAFNYSSTGASVAKKENSQVVSPVPNLVLIQNKCMDFVMYDLYFFLETEKASYSDYTTLNNPWKTRFNAFGI